MAVVMPDQSEIMKNVGKNAVKQGVKSGIISSISRLQYVLFYPKVAYSKCNMHIYCEVINKHNNDKG